MPCCQAYLARRKRDKEEGDRNPAGKKLIWQEKGSLGFGISGRVGSDNTKKKGEESGEQGREKTTSFSSL